MRTLWLLSGAVLLALATVSCSSGPTPPRPGTPGFYWGAAKDAYRTGDLPKTMENLAEVERTDNEFAARARVWDMVVSAGVASGYEELAENFEAGAKANRANPMPFHKQVTALRSLASGAAMQLAESAHVYLANDKEPTVPMAFEYPTGAAAEPGSLQRAAKGILLPDSERDALTLAMLQRGVLLSVCRATGSGDDPAKALEKFKAGEVRVARPVFLLAMAKALEEGMELYGSNKLDQPNRLKVLGQEGLDALQGVPESKETKALAAKIQAALKKIKGT